MAALKVIVFLVGINCVRGVQIVWDPDAVGGMYENELRPGEVKLPNWMLIYPGTKWCGVGNIAANYDDLGEYSRTDKCCRSHDFCDDYIDGYQSAHNLTNDRFYTRLHCDCDEAFYKCLKSVTTAEASSIGGFYFNALGTKCFREEHPIRNCKKYVYFPRLKCVLYDVNSGLGKIYQWFDLPEF